MNSKTTLAAVAVAGVLGVGAAALTLPSGPAETAAASATHHAKPHVKTITVHRRAKSHPAPAAPAAPAAPVVSAPAPVSAPRVVVVEDDHGGRHDEFEDRFDDHGGDDGGFDDHGGDDDGEGHGGHGED